MSQDSDTSIWDVLENSPAEAETMKLRSKLMMALEQHIKAKNWTQAEAARHMGVTQPRISDLKRGKIDLFALDGLVQMALAAGLTVDLQIRDAA